MKYWERPLDFVAEITLKGGDRGILSVEKEDGKFKFSEQCDYHFSETYTKEEALELVEELKEWINEN